MDPVVDLCAAEGHRVHRDLMTGVVVPETAPPAAPGAGLHRRLVQQSCQEARSPGANHVLVFAELALQHRDLMAPGEDLCPCPGRSSRAGAVGRRHSSRCGRSVAAQPITMPGWSPAVRERPLRAQAPETPAHPANGLPPGRMRCSGGVSPRSRRRNRTDSIRHPAVIVGPAERPAERWGGRGTAT